MIQDIKLGTYRIGTFMYVVRSWARARARASAVFFFGNY